MKKPWLHACLWLLGAGMVSLPAQTPPPSDFSDIEEFLNKSKSSRRQAMLQRVNTLAQRLNGALSNPSKLLELYKDDYAAVHFEGAKREHAKVKEWEEKNKAAFKEEGFQTALRLHAQYLVATLGKRAGDEEGAAKAALQWLDSFPRGAGKWEMLAKQELMTGGMANSIFLRAANQAAMAQGLQNWYAGDLTNLPELHRVDIIGFLRGKKDPQIFTEWQNNIKLEQEAAERDGLDAKKEYFKAHRHPWLLWQVGKDYALYGQHRNALNTMRGALENSPDCECYEQIVAEMERVAADAKKAAVKAPSPPAPSP